MAKDFVPRVYQKEATNFLLSTPRASLYVAMGMGKTSVVLDAIDTLMIAGFHGKILIIAPLRVARSTWKEESQKWNHLKHLTFSIIVGSQKERTNALKAEADIYCINYENLVWLIDELTKMGKVDWPFRMVVADESTRLKSHRSHYKKLKSGHFALYCTGGSRTSAIAKVAFTQTKRWVNLTGTPAPNGLQDLWGQQWFIDRGQSLGASHSAFDQRWFRTGFNGFSKEMFPHSELEIRSAIEPTTFTLRAEDYLALGEEITNTIYVDLPPVAREIYDEMEKNLYIELKSGNVEAFTAATRTTKLQQISNGAVYYDDQGNSETLHSVKIDALQSVIEEANGMPVIVVYQFKSDLERLLKAFPKGKHFSTNPKVERDFKAGLIPILFMHPASGGHGVDAFQYVTNIIVFFAVDWNLELRLQVIARIGSVRQFQAGLNRPVFIHQIIGRDTVDEIILDRLESKGTVEEALKKGLARKYKV